MNTQIKIIASLSALIIVFVFALGSYSNGILKTKAYTLYNGTLENLLDAEGLILDQKIESTNTIGDSQNGNGVQTAYQKRQFHFEWNKTPVWTEVILIEDITDGINTHCRADYYNKGVKVTVVNGKEHGISDYNPSKSTLREYIGPMMPINFSKDSIRVVKSEKNGENVHLTFEITGNSITWWFESPWSESDNYISDQDFGFDGIVEAIIDTDGNLVEVKYELTTSSNTQDGDNTNMVVEFKSTTNIIAIGSVDVNFPSDISFSHEPSVEPSDEPLI